MVEDQAKSGRKRGRPRTVTDDREVLEKRRKQLRLAQQAYRKRKETTISNLQNRVHELETGIEDLGHSFLSLSDLLIKEQLVSQHPGIASALEAITQKCASLAKAGSQEPTEATIVRATPSPEIADNNTVPKPVLDNSYSDSSTDVENIIRSAATSWPASSTPPYQDQSMPFGCVMSSPVQFPYVSPPLSDSPSTLDLLPRDVTPERKWNIAQRIVRTCCHNGYRLLINSPDHPKLEGVFGPMLSLTERNRLISGFYAVTQDKIGDLTDLKANVLHILRSNMSTFSHEQLQIPSRIWQIGLESASGEWMDGNGVQQYLCDKQAIFENYPDSSGRPEYSVSSSVDITAFIKCELSAAGYFDQNTNAIEVLAMEAICVGNGPAFQRQNVEKALRLATKSIAWTFDNLYDL
ncbi:hypothetical protein N7457_008271 [Penicillium paradoxum]|uniref:uncharacterized protein n=1 Tax=Penicillium paradoxum TaxID=176176 RepID=UPI002546B84E|nr:uncharacterized protein N7457_008271 [Penicillium paradoxum]KAJ5773375.1 hypothetical protein N7457_008271 [Penicillium paradoxum]